LKVVLAIALDLLLSAVFLLGWRVGWIRVGGAQPQDLFLQFVNTNMLLCASAAVIAAAVGVVRRRSAGRGAGAAAILLAAMLVFTLAEALIGVAEFVRTPGWFPTASQATTYSARALVLIWAFAVVLGRGDGAGLRALDPRTRPAIAWPAIGLAIYLLTDLARYRLDVVGGRDFALGELGFFAGYLAVALGAYRPFAADVVGRAAE
jgi:hypothetical protein